MQLQVKLFATLKDRAGTNQVEIELDAPATVASLRTALGDRYPALASALPISIVSVNREFSDPDTEIKAGDEIALFPPVSGG